MTTFSVGFGHVRGIGPEAGSTLPAWLIDHVERAIARAARTLGGSHICTTRGEGRDELGSPEPCSVIVVEVPDERADRFRAWLAGAAAMADQRCFGVIAGATEFIGPVIPEPVG